MVPADRLAEWVSRLVQIPSVSPGHAGPRAGTTGEALIARQVAAWFREFGAEVHVAEAAPGRPNVFGIWRGKSPRLVAADVHLDTVSVEQMSEEPFSGRIANGQVRGRGAVDTKASLGVILALLEAMHRAGATPEPTLLVAATVDEEDGALGAPAAAAWMRERNLLPEEMTVAEPTLCVPVFAHKGVLRMEFTVRGVPAHSSQPWLGKNAVTAAARAVLALEAEHQRLQEAPPHETLGHGCLTVTVIRGGRGANVVPDTCTFSIDRRLLAGESGDTVAERLARLVADACPLPVESTLVKQIGAFAQPPDSPWAGRLAGWTGTTPTIAPYCTNAWAYAGLARECVVIGPGSIDQAHGPEEWVEIAELEKMAGLFSRWWGLA